MVDWLELENRFRELSETLTHLRLDIQTGAAGEHRNLKGAGLRSPKTDEFRSLSALAGKTLARAIEDESGELEGDSDHWVEVWYIAIEKLSGQVKWRPTAFQVDDEGNREPIHSGTVRNVATVSANLCLDLHRKKPTSTEDGGDTEINIFKGQFGYLSTGDVENVESISVNVQNLQTQDEEKFAQAIKELTDAVGQSEELSQEQKVEAIEQIEELSNQATLAEEERSSRGVLKALITALGGTLSAAGGVAEVWSTWGPVIRSYFEF